MNTYVTTHKNPLWQYEDARGMSCVGPCYARKDELLADLNRYATEYGL